MPAQNVTEVVTVNVKSGVDINDKTNPAYQIWREITAIVSQQEGFQRARFGNVVEDQSIVQVLVDWDSHDVETQEKFRASAAFGPFSSNLGSIAEALEVHHFQPKSFPPSILDSAPVVEISTLFHAEPHFLGNVEKFFEESFKSGIEGYIGHTYGPVVEDIEKSAGEGKGPAVMLCIGWESKEAHMKFRKTKTFEENIHYLREGSDDAEMHHTVFQGI